MEFSTLIYKHLDSCEGCEAFYPYSLYRGIGLIKSIHQGQVAWVFLTAEESLVVYTTRPSRPYDLTWLTVRPAPDVRSSSHWHAVDSRMPDGWNRYRCWMERYTSRYGKDALMVDFFCKNVLQFANYCVPLHSQNKSNSVGALVQLVRIHACHAWGHGFESRTHRKACCFYYINKV